MDTLYNKKRVPYIEKNNGTIMLKEHSNYKAAIEHYNKALFSIKILTEDRNLEISEDYVQKVIEEVEIPVMSNLTLCYLKENDFQNVIKYSTNLLANDPDNVKILYRRGVAYTNVMEFDKAKADLIHANKLEPKNTSILDALKSFKQKKLEYKYKSQQICQKIFDNEGEKLYPEEAKKPKDKAEPEVQNNLEQGSIPYYLRQTLEIGFAIPLVMYKMLLEKPATKVLQLGSSVVTIPDYLPIVGGC